MSNSFRSRPTGITDVGKATAKAVEADRVFSAFLMKPMVAGILMILLAVAYITSAGLYGAGVGIGGAVVNGNATVLPYYKLHTKQATYQAAGLAKPLGTDLPYVVPTTYTTGDLTVFVESHTFGLLVTLALLYTVAPSIVAAYTEKTGDEKKDTEVLVKKLTNLNKVLFTLAVALVWMFVQTDLMFILGNDDKVASWMATGVILAQVGLYHAAENAQDLDAEDPETEVSLRDLLGVQHIIVVLALLVGGYLLSMSIGVGIIMPLDYAGGINAVHESYRSVIAFYLTTQFVEFTRFALIVVGNSSARAKPIGNWLKKSATVSVFGHAWVFVLAAMYAFHPGSVIYQAGEL